MKLSDMSAVKFNGTDIDVVKYNGAEVWRKAVLSGQTGFNSSDYVAESIELYNDGQYWEVYNTASLAPLYQCNSNGTYTILGYALDVCNLTELDMVNSDGWYAPSDESVARLPLDLDFMRTQGLSEVTIYFQSGKIQCKSTNISDGAVYTVTPSLYLCGGYGSIGERIYDAYHNKVIAVKVTYAEEEDEYGTVTQQYTFEDAEIIDSVYIPNNETCFGWDESGGSGEPSIINIDFSINEINTSVHDNETTIECSVTSIDMPISGINSLLPQDAISLHVYYDQDEYENGVRDDSASITNGEQIMSVNTKETADLIVGSSWSSNITSSQQYQCGEPTINSVKIYSNALAAQTVFEQDVNDSDIDGSTDDYISISFTSYGRYIDDNNVTHEVQYIVTLTDNR